MLLDHAVIDPNIRYWLSTISSAFRDLIVNVDYNELVKIGITNNPDQKIINIVVERLLRLAALIIAFALFLVQGNPDDRDRQ